jgi:hypothetical protein
MIPIKSIYEIEEILIDLRKYLRSKDALVVKKARKKYEKWVDRFFRENVNFIEPEKRYHCFDDDNYFLTLMESTKESH